MSSPSNRQYIQGPPIWAVPSPADVDGQPLFLRLRNGGSGPFTGGHGDNGLKLIVYYVLEDITPDWAVAVDPSTCSSTLWSDDFEGGDALSVDYTGISGAVKAAGVGRGGSQGVHSDGAFLAEFQKTFTPNSRNGCISFDIKADAALHAGDGFGFGSYLVEVHDPTGPGGLTQFGLSSGGDQEAGTDFGDLFIYDSGFATQGSAADEALSDGVYATVRVEFETSSVPGGVAQADAWVKVYVEDVLVIDVSGLTISAYHAVNNPNNYWGGVRFVPQGAGDNLLVRH